MSMVIMLVLGNQVMLMMMVLKMMHSVLNLVITIAMAISHPTACHEHHHHSCMRIIIRQP